MMERGDEADPLIRIVDDDISQREALSFLLSSVGYRVAGYASAKEFLTLDEHWVRGCVILDLRMPDMDGLVLQQEMARRRINLPVVFLSAFGDLSTAVQAMKQGSFDFLEKPVDEAKLLSSLAEILLREKQNRLFRTSPEEVRRKFEQLTEQERHITELYVHGLLKREIAERLGLSRKTVDNHLQSVYKKFAIHSIAELNSLWEILKNAP